MLKKTDDLVQEGVPFSIGREPGVIRGHESQHFQQPFPPFDTCVAFKRPLFKGQVADVELVFWLQNISVLRKYPHSSGVS